MIDFSSISNLPAGAQFLRGDLHIHSTPASHDVMDAGMTPANIVSAAEKENLSFISITDHNEISNVAAALHAAQGRPVTVIPGVELSTPEGHLLAYFPTLESLQRFYSRLDLADRGESDSRCMTSMLQCLSLIGDFSGFGILAHVDGGKGLESVLPGGSPHKRDILCQKSLLGIELKSVDSDISFSDSDPEQVRRNLGRKRIELLSLGKQQHLARVLFSDSHSLDRLGRNSREDRKVTRFKVQSPTFDALRHALMFADARVRIEEEIPDAVPFIEGVEIFGGFLDGQHVRFSRNLTCIIGGRGTGKSTLLEATRSISNMRSQSPLVDSEVWPDTLGIFWRDQAGGLTKIRREKYDVAVNEDEHMGVTTFPIECYSQNEISVKNQPDELLRFLDQFIDLSDTQEEDERARQKLKKNQELIESLGQEVGELPSTQRLLADTKRQLDALQAAHGKDIIIFERGLAEEKHLQQLLNETTNSYFVACKESPEINMMSELDELPSSAELKIGRVPLESIRRAAAQLLSDAAPYRAKLAELQQRFKRELGAQIQEWNAGDARVRQTIHKKRTELEAQGVPLNMDYIRRLSHDLRRYSAKEVELKKKKVQLKQARRDRQRLVQDRINCREKISMIRNAYAKQASHALKDTLGDLSLSVKYQNNSFSPDAEGIIARAMNWRTSQVPRSHLLVTEVSVLGLLKALKNKDSSELTCINNGQSFTKSQAKEIIDTLSEERYCHELEQCPMEDLPQILVTAKPAGQDKTVTRGFERLSLGQQQSVLLSLMLTSSSKQPLIIDQPEDNLDGEFIYRSLVAALRRAKERRQVIVVTHNANIAVLGDAEQLIVLKGFNDSGRVVVRESIEDPEARAGACQVLEGTVEAFRRRSEIYGLS